MSVKNALDSFAYDVIDGAKRNLKSKGKNASGDLSKSLDYKLKISGKKDKYTLTFLMEGYGEFIDRGVKGAGGVRRSGKDIGKKWEKKTISNKSIFKQNKGYTNKKPPASAFSDWSVRKGIAPRNAKGQFTSRKSLQFAIANSVFHTGITGSNFITNPFNKAFKELPNEVLKGLSLEIDKQIKIIVK
jgi:hypothetical protein